MSYSLTVTVDGMVFKVEYHEGDPGRISGPPENCYPPEPPEIEIITVTLPDGTVVYPLALSAFDLDLGENEDLYDRLLKACDEPMRAIYAEEDAGWAAYEENMRKAEADYEEMLRREGFGG